MAKSINEVKTGYKELANTVKEQTRQGYRLESAYCNPDNLKEIICVFSRVSVHNTPDKPRTDKKPGNRGSRKKTV
jgi:hypothetical protein